jgi:hypothetical protein
MLAPEVPLLLLQSPAHESCTQTASRDTEGEIMIGEIMICEIMICAIMICAIMIGARMSVRQ